MGSDRACNGESIPFGVEPPAVSGNIIGLEWIKTSLGRLSEWQLEITQTTVT